MTRHNACASTQAGLLSRGKHGCNIMAAQGVFAGTEPVSPPTSRVAAWNGSCRKPNSATNHRLHLHVPGSAVCQPGAMMTLCTGLRTEKLIAADMNINELGSHSTNQAVWHPGAARLVHTFHLDSMSWCSCDVYRVLISCCVMLVGIIQSIRSSLRAHV